MKPIHVLPLIVLLSACGDDFQVTATLDEDMPTWVHLSWATRDPGLSWVEFGPTRQREYATPVSSEPSTQHEFILKGLPVLADGYYRAVTQVGDDELVTTGRVETGGRASSLPDFELRVNDSDRLAEANFLLFSATGTFSALCAVDREGRWVWYRARGEGEQVVELEFDEQTPDAFLFNTFSTDHTVDEGYVLRQSFDGSVDDEIRTELAHHAFTQLTGGDLAYVAIDIRDWYDEELGEEVPVVGDAVVVVPAEGEPWVLFSTWDWREPVKHERWDGGFYPQGYDWSHGNSLRYYEDSDTLLMSFRNLETIIELDASTGEVLREFGAYGYGFAEGTRPFLYPHDPGWTSEGNLTVVSTDEETVVMEYEVDDEAGLLTEVWSVGDGEAHQVLAQGMMQELDNGNRFISWGSAGLLQEVTADGQVVWELATEVGWIFGSVVLLDTFYP